MIKERQREGDRRKGEEEKKSIVEVLYAYVWLCLCLSAPKKAMDPDQDPGFFFKFRL